MRTVNELPSIYEASTIDPPASHIVAAVMGGLYLVLFVGFLLAWADARAPRRRAEAARSQRLEVGPAQLVGSIEGTARVVDAPDERVAQVEAAPFTLMTDHGPVRVVSDGPAKFVAGQLSDRPLRGGVAYRRVPLLPWLGALGAGTAMPGSSFFFAVIFLVCALRGAVAIVATQLEGGPGH